jgi:hypothetical protein
MNDHDLDALMAYEAPSADQLTELSALVAQLRGHEEHLTGVESYANQLKATIHRLKTEAIPQAMASAGCSDFVTEGGLRVKLKDVVSGSLPKLDKVKRQAAIDWIREHGGTDLVKTEMMITFERGQDNLVGAIAETAESFGVEHETNEGVHHSTLKSFVREKIRDGVDVPYETLGVFVGREAEVTVTGKEKMKR